MNTILYSVAGILLLVLVALFFNYISLLRDKKWQSKIKQIRDVVFYSLPKRDGLTFKRFTASMNKRAQQVPE